MSADGLFTADDDGYTASELAIGPWSPDALHGGPPAALLARVLADAVTAPGLRLARLTLELVRPVPRGPLTVAVTPVRGGRRMTLLDGSLLDGDGVEVTRARALFLVAAEVSATPAEPPPFAGPEDGTVNDWASQRPMFATHGMEIRFVEGSFRAVGPATAWFRLTVPLIAGQPTGAAQRAVAAGDFGNGIAPAVSWEGHTFINPDLTVFLERDPVDEWVAVQAVTRAQSGSVAMAESVLWDRRGRIGRAVQTLLIAARD